MLLFLVINIHTKFYFTGLAIVRALSKVDQAIFESNHRDVVQLFEATAPHLELRAHLPRYKWLVAIYEIYLEEFRRLDFDPEIYAAKTRKLIEESSTVNLKNHLPSIHIDEKYLDNLKSSKLSASDKAEKIIRDIETVIRRNEIDNPVYVEFQERLDELIKEKESETKSISDLLKDLEELFGEVEQAATLPQKMGFDDRGSFDIYIEIKNARDESINLEIAKDFAKKLAQRIKNKIYIGWQDVDAEIKRFEVDIKIFADFDEYESLNISDDTELVERILKRIIQHYSIE